jgi:hypoxanthine phosphoribosyltransferase
MTTKLTPVLTEQQILGIVAGLAEKLSVDYRDRDLVAVGILKGSFIFLADLVRKITIPVKIDFMGASSYGKSSHTSGEVRFTASLGLDIEGKDVLIVEDIIDTGLTLVSLVEYLKAQKPRSIKICTLIDKRERREASVSIDYSGAVVENGFLVGYGLDYAENYRNLPGIYHVDLTPSEEMP